jgi:multidrug efflux system membrane fusion protein
MQESTPSPSVVAQDAAPWTGAPASKRKPWLWIGAAVLALALIWALKGGKGDAAAKGAGARAIPVVAATARTKDVSVVLTGLGTVTPLNSANVRSRVDGQLSKIYFREGQNVAAGQLLAEIDPRPFQVQLTQAQGQYAKDEAALKNARMDLDRVTALLKQGIVSTQQLDTQQATVNQYEGALKSDLGQVESAKLNLTYSRITAPVAGRAGLRLVEPGNMVRATDPNGLVVITPMHPITVLFTLPADQVTRVLEQSSGSRKLSAEAWDRDFKTKLAVGTLQAVDNQVDPTTGTVRLRAEFANKDEVLFPNQFVNIRLELSTLKNAVVVPSSALQRSPQGTYVYVIKADGTVEARDVIVAFSEGDDAALAKGLASGEKVVTDGVDKLRPGSKVTVPDQDGAKKAR